MIVKVHITLIILFLYNLFFGKIESLFICYMFILMHELVHIIVALCLNVDIKEISLTPFGVNAVYDGKIKFFENRNLSSYKVSLMKEFFISIAGPIASLFFAFLYNNESYYIINICIVIFNLIPIYPFDGGRILKVILYIIFGREKGQSISTYLTTLFIVILFLIAIFIAAYYKNFFLLMMTGYIIKIAREEIQKDKIIRAINYLQTDK